MSSKLSLVLTTLALFLKIHKTKGRLSAMSSADAPKDMLNKLKRVFKVGQCIMVYNIGVSSEDLEGDEIVCAERRAGKSYCKEVENYIEATRLDKIDPEQFGKFQEYFKDDLEQTQMVATRMDVDDSKTKVIYPEGAETEDSKWDKWDST